jgi:hypothetical protein
VVTFSALELRVKTLDHAVSMMAVCVSLLSWCVIVELQFYLVSFSVSLVASFGCPCTFLFIFDLL